MPRSSHRRCSIKKRCSEKFPKIDRKTPVPGSLSKKTPSQKEHLWCLLLNDGIMFKIENRHHDSVIDVIPVLLRGYVLSIKVFNGAVENIFDF